jgi:IPT/TIG domain-containing protein
MPSFEGPTPEEIKDEEENRLVKLRRARIILAIYYVVMPFLLIYLLFKIFPPYPWYPADYRLLQMVFLIPKLNIWTTLEERLILLVTVAGALGSYIHSATSYSDYRGNRQFGPSWLLWYLLRPLIGVCLALVVYFAMRGGLLSMVLSGTVAQDPKNINPFGLAAIAGLTGMFSKQAADKLAEVFTTLFKSTGDENRKDSLAPAPTPVIKLIAPNQGPEAGKTEVVVTGTSFAAEATVSFGDQVAADIKVVNDTTITLLTPPGKGTVDVVVVNKDGQKVTALKGFSYIAEAPPAPGSSDPASEPTDSDSSGPATDADDASPPVG